MEVRESRIHEDVGMNRRMAITGASLATAVILGSGLGWAGRTLLAPPAPLPSQQSFSVVESSSGAVSRTIRLAAQANWAGGVAVPNLAEGTVTRQRVSDASSVKAGQPLYDVDLRAVSVTGGKVPAFRTMTAGTSGADVSQLQAMLRELGLRSSAPDGRFGADTARQVRAWQRSIGEPRTGEVALGSLLFIPTLPATVVLGDGLAVGSRVSAASDAGATGGEASDGGETASVVSGAVVRVLPAAPSFSISLPENQARLAREGMRVDIDHDGQVWSAVIDRVGDPGADGTAVAVLKSATDAPICASDCASVPVGGAAGLDATIFVVPEAKGVVVPAAALVVGPDGSAAVLAEDGTRVPVTVKASAGGRSVVEGIEAGAKVRVPGADAK